MRHDTRMDNEDKARFPRFSRPSQSVDPEIHLVDPVVTNESLLFLLKFPRSLVSYAVSYVVSVDTHFSHHSYELCPLGCDHSSSSVISILTSQNRNQKDRSLFAFLQKEITNPR
jgi:hypothetical protein